jgi:hypothetical protein
LVVDFLLALVSLILLAITFVTDVVKLLWREVLQDASLGECAWLERDPLRILDFANVFGKSCLVLGPEQHSGRRA